MFLIERTCCSVYCEGGYKRNEKHICILTEIDEEKVEEGREKG